MESFTACGLTKEKDKLIALSGIAKEMREFLDDRYFAGHWAKNLTWDLLWYVYNGNYPRGDPTFRPEEYRGKLFSLLQEISNVPANFPSSALLVLAIC